MDIRDYRLLTIAIVFTALGLQSLGHAAPAEIVVDCGKPLGNAAAISDFLGAGGALEGPMADPKNPLVEGWSNATNQEIVNKQKLAKTGNPKLSKMGKGGKIYPGSLSRFSAYKPSADSPVLNAGINLKSRFGVDVGAQDFYGNKLPPKVWKI